MSLMQDPINLVTVLFTLLSASVGLATMIMAAMHGSYWNESSRHSALATNLITWALVRDGICTLLYVVMYISVYIY